MAYISQSTCVHESFANKTGAENFRWEICTPLTHNRWEIQPNRSKWNMGQIFGLKGLSSKPSGDYIVVPNFCFFK